MATESGKGPMDKVEDVKEKAEDKLEPSEEELSQAGGPAAASSPFSDGERSDEQQSG